MNNTFEILVLLVFFVPVGLMVALNLLAYREGRYVAQPPAPTMASEPVAERIAQPLTEPVAEPLYDYELRRAA